MARWLAAWALLPAAFQDKEPPPDPLVQKVCEMYRARSAALFTQASGSRTRLEEALAQAARIDDTVADEVSKKLKATPDEVREAWKKRDRKPRKAAYGDGTWVVLGGQDGGLDSAVKGTPKNDKDFVEGAIDRNPGVLTKRKPPAPPEPVPLGKPLKTRDEWWATASSSERAAFVEAEYARKSARVEKKEDVRKCSACAGKGAVNVIRGGVALAARCARCHGVKEDLAVTYE